MKEKLLNVLASPNRTIVEGLKINNRSLLVSIMALFSLLEDGREHKKITLVYHGENFITFLMLFLTAYFFNFKLIKVLNIQQLQDKIINIPDCLVFVDNGVYTETVANKIRELAVFTSFVVFKTHNVKYVPILLVNDYGERNFVTEVLKDKINGYQEKSHVQLIALLKTYLNDVNDIVITDEIILELPSSGVYSPTKHIGFGRHNVNSIERIISKLPKLRAHDNIRIFASIDSAFFYMLSVYMNSKTLVLGASRRSNLAIELYKTKQAVIIDSVNMMYLWEIHLKDFIFSNINQFLGKYKLTSWIVGLKIQLLLTKFFGHSLKSLYIINADLPIEFKKLLRSSFMKVVFLYGLRETGNILGSNCKKDKISLDSYKIENYKGGLNLVQDSMTSVLFIKGNALANSCSVVYNSDSKKEEDLYFNTKDVCYVDLDVLTFISPLGTAMNTFKDQLNFDLYFTERSLRLSPFVKQALSFDYEGKWYIAVEVDTDYLDRFNIDVFDVEKQLEDVRQKANINLPAEKSIAKIEVSSTPFILNSERKPIRFIHKMEDLLV